MNQALESKLDLIIQMLGIHDKRFEQIDKRFEQIDKRFDRVDDEIQDIRYEQREDKKMIMDIWKTRNEVTARLNWDFAWKFIGLNFSILILMIIFTKIV